METKTFRLPYQELRLTLTCMDGEEEINLCADMENNYIVQAFSQKISDALQELLNQGLSADRCTSHFGDLQRGAIPLQETFRLEIETSSQFFNVSIPHIEDGREESNRVIENE